AIIGASMEVHKVLGHGFLEAVYQEALAEEFQQRGILFAEQVELPINYKGKLLNYLKASGYHRGLLINFGARSLQYERLVWG
ncbi:MAG TPA: GxxExxY protein, partial [Roseiflexaceae bacterium]|nr:GxxExxY protein [Roseiflexaceae bacterium]